jgi:PEGA domain-containing protein
MRVVRYAVLATVTANSPPVRATSVTVTSMAPGSRIYVNGQHVGTTPARIALSARHENEITVRGAEGEHTCRISAQPWIIHGVYATPAWLVERLNGPDEWGLDATLPGF